MLRINDLILTSHLVLNDDLMVMSVHVEFRWAGAKNLCAAGRGGLKGGL